MDNDAVHFMKARTAPLPPADIAQDLFDRPTHTLARSIQKAWEQDQADATSNYSHVMKVGKRSLARSLQFLSALIYALEDRGHSVQLEKGKWYERLHAVIDGEPIRFTLIETVTSLKTASPVPGASLQFVIEGGSRDVQSGWKDGKVFPIEEKIPEILPALEQHMPFVRQERIRRYEAERERLQTESNLQMRAQRNAQFNIDLKNWSDAEQIRAFIAAALAAYPDPASLKRDHFDWFAWAMSLADRKDPLRKQPQAFLSPYVDKFDEARLRAEAIAKLIGLP